MDVKRNIGSTHIIDGEKVSIRYQGQIKTCNKCHQEATTCSGKGLAKDCTTEKILLSDHMISYWKAINFNPETAEMNDVDMENENYEEADKPKVIDQVKTNSNKVTVDSDMYNRYGGVVIKGFKKDSDLTVVVETLKEAGLPFDYEKEDLHIVDKHENITIYINDLKPETCVEMSNNLHGEEKSGKKLSVYSLVEDSPTKQLGNELEKLLEDKTDATTSDVEEAAKEVSNETVAHSPNTSPAEASPSTSTSMIHNFVTGMTSRFWNNGMDDFKLSDDSSDDENADEIPNDLKLNFNRKANWTPEKDEFETILSRKEKKKLKKSLNKSN